MEIQTHCWENAQLKVQKQQGEEQENASCFLLVLKGFLHLFIILSII